MRYHPRRSFESRRCPRDRVERVIDVKSRAQADLLELRGVGWIAEAGPHSQPR